MKVGTVREIKTHEYRVGLTPASVKSYVSRGHTVYVEAGAGANAGFEDNEYRAAGARIVADKKKVATENPEAKFYHGKLQSAIFFTSNILPQVKARAEVMKNADRSALDVIF